MTDPRKIDATELDSVATSTDGTRVRLQVRDQTGQSVCFTLPASWLNSVLNAMPRQPLSTRVHHLDSWSIERTPTGEGLILTLRTPEGQSVSFAIKSWQVEGMATIATYGTAPGTALPSVH